MPNNPCELAPIGMRTLPSSSAKIIGYIDMYRHLTGLTNDDVVGQFQYRINSYTVWFKDPARLTEFVLRCPSTSVYTYKVIDK